MSAAALLTLVDGRLGELLVQPGNGASDTLARAIREGVLAPGKRIRPLLMLLAARGLSHALHPAILDLACAVEMVHTASLFLDDLPCMDNARLRRGQPTLHLRYGEDVAVLGAVALLSHAWRLVATAKDVPDAIRTRLVVVLSDAIGLQGLVRGQYRDLHQESAREWQLHSVECTNQEKTGALFSAALEIVALVCGADVHARAALLIAATELGHAFQLYDDLQDGDNTSTRPITKDQCKDDGKVTMVALLGRREAQLRLHCHLEAMEGALNTALVLDNGAVAMLRAAFALDNAPKPGANL